MRPLSPLRNSLERGAAGGRFRLNSNDSTPEPLDGPPPPPTGPPAGNSATCWPGRTLRALKISHWRLACPARPGSGPAGSQFRHWALARRSAAPVVWSRQARPRATCCSGPLAAPSGSIRLIRERAAGCARSPRSRCISGRAAARDTSNYLFAIFNSLASERCPKGRSIWQSSWPAIVRRPRRVATSRPLDGTSRNRIRSRWMEGVRGRSAPRRMMRSLLAPRIMSSGRVTEPIWRSSDSLNFFAAKRLEGAFGPPTDLSTRCCSCRQISAAKIAAPPRQALQSG